MTRMHVDFLFCFRAVRVSVPQREKAIADARRRDDETFETIEPESRRAGPRSPARCATT